MSSWIKRGRLVTGLLLALLSPAIAPAGFGLEPLTRPLVTLPTNWSLASEVLYPHASSEYDPQGAGMLLYVDELDQDHVMIYYERASVSQWTNASLTAKATEIFKRTYPSVAIIDSGTMTIAGVTGGYAEAHDTQQDAYNLQTVFQKGLILFRAYANYEATHYAEAQVTSLLNSITVREPSSISCSVDTTSPRTGEQVTIQGTILPSCPTVQVTISVQAPDGQVSAIVATTNILSDYSASYTPNNPGIWSFRASWDGNDAYKGADSSISHLTVETAASENPPPYSLLAIAASVLGIAVLLTLFKKKKGFHLRLQ